MSTEAPPLPKKPPPLPPPSKAAPPKAPGAAGILPSAGKSFSLSKGSRINPLKVVIYGCGGIGKSELAANLSQLGLKVLFIDIENGSSHLDVTRVEGVESYDDLRAVMNSDLPNQFDAVVCDSLTKAEELDVHWVIANIPHEKGYPIRSIEDYGWGRGTTHVFEAYLNLIADFDSLVRRGKHVICIAHECVEKVPNPMGEDWIRYEPRLQSPKTNNANSIRHRMKEWCDHLLYVGYDVASKDGKGQGAGTRCIYPNERPSWWAKSRTLSKEIPYTKGSADLWRQLLERSE